MRFIADLHIHSRYSRATSRQLIPEQLWRWGQLKGLQVIATGDITHPQWLAELEEALQPSAGSEGFFELKPAAAAAVRASVPPACQGNPLFILSGEISSIYKKEGEVRKVHNDNAARALHAARLEHFGRIASTGPSSA